MILLIRSFSSPRIISFGDGKCTPFLEAKWLQNVAPKDIAPHLYKRAKFKNRTVHAELKNHNWTYNIHGVKSYFLLEELVTLYIMLSSVNLSNEHVKIVWRWTPNDQYSISSAYGCQFRGAMSLFPAMDI
jgi:hypothetical protein